MKRFEILFICIRTYKGACTHGCRLYHTYSEFEIIGTGMLQVAEADGPDDGYEEEYEYEDFCEIP